MKFFKNFIVIIMNYFLSVQECSVDMNFNLLLIKLKVIGKFAKQSFFINFYDLFSGDSKNENIIKSLGIAKTKTESIDEETGEFV